MKTGKKFRTNVLAIAVITAAIGLTGPNPAAAQVSLELVAGGLASPTDITHAGDGSGRLFIALRDGRIVIHDGQALLPDPFLDIRNRLTAGGERGLLGLAFHPRYASNGFFYVNYTDLNSNTVIARFAVSADPDRSDPSSETVILSVVQPFSNHNGGQLQFGPDGYLYIAMGDGGNSGDPQNNAQNPDSLLGKMLRIDIDGGSPYTIPGTNPFVGIAGTRDEIWALGLRNPWRFSFDRTTGDLFIADVGQNAREEVNFQPAASAGGENYGWRRMEASLCFKPSANCYDRTLTLPVIAYDHNADCSVTGGYRYRGTGVPAISGQYVFGDFCSGLIWGATEAAGGGWIFDRLLDSGLRISTFGEDENGEIYVADLGAPEGAVYRFVPGSADTSDSSGGSGGSGGCFISATGS